MLVLFDIDGTLLHGAPEGHAHAMADAMRTVWGVPVVLDDVWATQPAGRTDREIARLVLRGHSVADVAIDACMREWIDLGCTRIWPTPIHRPWPRRMPTPYWRP